MNKTVDNSFSDSIKRPNLNYLKDDIRFLKKKSLKKDSEKESKKSEQYFFRTSQIKSRNSFSINQTRLSQLNPKIDQNLKNLIDNPILLIYVKSIVESINSFSFDFYKHTSANISKNVAFSPLSLFHILNILYSCSDDFNKRQIRQVLHLTRPDSEKYLPLLIDLLNNNFDSNHGTNHITIKSNALAKESFLLKKYVELMETNLGVDLIENSNFLKKEIDDLKRKDINEKFSNVFMMLNNNLDLELSWKTEFNLNDTKGLFTKSNDEKIWINLMNISKKKFLYAKNPFDLPLKICEFPFLNEDYVFTVILPEKKMINQIEEKLNYELFDSIIKQMKYVEVDTLIPKFKIVDEYDVCKILESLGAERLVDFKNKSKGLCIDKSFYVTKIFFSDKKLSISSESNFILSREPSEKVVIDHPSEEFNCENPFLFYVRNKSSNLILFMGKLVVPNDT